ncbi:putative divalent metal ion transporter SMF3 [Cyberlindnera jadinii NRRL Y-1542]|uniref:Natural resistance-associated macrophage protein n=1 Tax=Cyberlindnera jadinii (strain ATCC 18201 / CBS 1600 / BCRC 20928 / JCM 3617 / NBRC 0987 / NRRL Y-1542) TaxID=983966 RepID=A0A1E4RUG7_CYBJN|nr:natural resistance-associated macrophage protein [Cyberlindnera jadinii NRRL Y-1542]ODV70913.1 natural resistance-associated macrophage protein [Cyberlindnera jadinii NRRL Y-1542]
MALPIDNVKRALAKYAKFVGPGIMVAVAYMDPGNYSTSVSGGANYEYKLLFAVLLSNIFAVILQSLCIKLGSVTGLDLAENCRKHLPRWLNLTLYVFAELAIIATDLAEVVGTAIALEILFNIPLTYGVALTVLDVLLILFVYRPESNSMRNVRGFEIFVSVFVFLTCACFVIELFKIDVPDKLHVFRGFLPSKELTEQNGIYLSLGILGATVMPHSLYLGSSLVKPRLTEYDIKHNHQRVDPVRPTLQAIQYCLKYSYAELIISLTLIATFVNSAILIVAGATLYGQPDADDADLLTIYEMLTRYISPAAGLVFAWAMLFSGQSAGIVCTMAGQIVSEGFIQWSVSPWARRLLTRLIAIVPCLFVTLTMGRKGIADILNGSQVCLSMILPFVSAPLIYFTSVKKFMQVEVTIDESDVGSLMSSDANDYGATRTGRTHHPRPPKAEIVDYTNSKWVASFGIITWLCITVFNFYLIISFLLGADIHF